MLSSEAEPDGEGGGGMPFKVWQLMDMLDQLSDNYKSRDIETVLRWLEGMYIISTVYSSLRAL